MRQYWGYENQYCVTLKINTISISNYYQCRNHCYAFEAIIVYVALIYINTISCLMHQKSVLCYKYYDDIYLKMINVSIITASNVAILSYYLLKIDIDTVQYIKIYANIRFYAPISQFSIMMRDIYFS